MIDFATLQKIVKEGLEEDRAINVVETSGPTLEAAVAEAAALLNVPAFRVEYEILYRGFSGFLGTGKTDWKIRAYEKALTKKKRSRARGDGGEYEDSGEAVVKYRDGDFFIQRRTAGAFLKVIPPIGEGKPPSAELAMLYLNDRGAVEIDGELVKTVVEEAKDEYVRVANFKYELMNGSSVKFEIDSNDMKAYMTVTRPGQGGCDLTAEEYLQQCKQNKIYYGIKEGFIREFADKPVYSEKVEIAEGTRAVDGKDAYIQYNFDTDANKVKIKENKDGRVDFKELNIIKNVVQNQILARKIPPEEGVPGKTISGAMLTATNGKDIPMPVGENTALGTEEPDTIIAEINGQVLIINGLITVEPVYNVEGDVNMATGNILFLGAVVVKGNVDDGFTVKATGNITINGLVSKAHLEAEGDIIIAQGVNGKSGGSIKAGKSVYAKFLENAHVFAGDSVVAEESIVNSNVDAMNKISCRGKKATIIGGHLRAKEGISAKVIGSATSGTETICEVGFDPASQQELAQLHETKKEMSRELEDIKLELQTLINIKKQRKSLPADKEAMLQSYTERRAILMDDLKKIVDRVEKINEYLSALKSSGFVSASASVYTGAIIIIRNIREVVSSEYKSVTFLLDGDLVKVKPYDEDDEEH